MCTRQLTGDVYNILFVSTAFLLKIKKVQRWRYTQ